VGFNRHHAELCGTVITLHGRNDYGPLKRVPLRGPNTHRVNATAMIVAKGGRDVESSPRIRHSMRGKQSNLRRVWQGHRPTLQAVRNDTEAYSDGALVRAFSLTASVWDVRIEKSSISSPEEA